MSSSKTKSSATARKPSASSKSAATSPPAAPPSSGANGEARSERSDDAADDPICLIVGVELTAKQWLYLDCLQDFVDSGRPPTIGNVSHEAKVDRRSVSRWRRDPKFLKACARIVRAANRVDEELADRANLRMALQGSAAHYELLLRRRGLYDQLPPDAPIGMLPGGGPVGIQAGTVNFYGLPAPPSREERERLNPPQGSNKILEAQAVRK